MADKATRAVVWLEGDGADDADLVGALETAGYEVRRARAGPPPPPSATVARLQDPADGGQRPLSVLVVDNDQLIHQVLRANFERQGWFVAAASDGSEAVEMADEHGFDLVVLDLNLPYKNGFELLSEFGGTGASAGPRMVVLSAERQQQSVLRAFELGADDFVDKPVNPDILIARIKRLSRRR